MNTLLFTVLGYLSGSVLYARVASSLFGRDDLAAGSSDDNPGTFNAFKNGGFACGVFTLIGDIGKAFFPVWLYLISTDEETWRTGISLVLWAPVFGHLFPLFFGFHGGKGIAASFGSLLGLWAGAFISVPVLCLAFLFLLFKLVIRVSPDFYMTGLVFLLFPLLLLPFGLPLAILAGGLMISGSVLFRLSLSKEERGELEVKLLWMR